MYISIDMGATNTRVASTKDLKTVYKGEKFLTAGNLEMQRLLIKNSVKNVCDNGAIDFMVVGVPGIVDSKARKFVNVPNCPLLNGLAFDALIDIAISNVKFDVYNDTLLAGFGEAIFGVGKVFNSVGYLSLGTGVGGMRFEKTDNGLLYFACEPGHMIIVEGGRVAGGCDHHGCLEAYVSGKSFEEIHKIKAEDCNDQKIWSDYATYLSKGVLNLIALWMPQILVFGGSVSKKIEMFYGPLLLNLQKQTFFPIPEIKKSVLDDDAGIYGGFALMESYLAKLTPQR